MKSYIPHGIPQGSRRNARKRVLGKGPDLHIGSDSARQ